MAKEERNYMPAGMGGLMRFGDEEEPYIKVQPRHIIYVITGIVAFELALKFIL